LKSWCSCNATTAEQHHEKQIAAEGLSTPSAFIGGACWASGSAAFWGWTFLQAGYGNASIGAIVLVGWAAGGPANGATLACRRTRQKKLNAMAFVEPVTCCPRHRVGAT
jgi:hypothetical protein